jgi:hypothetical protein
LFLIFYPSVFAHHDWNLLFFICLTDIPGVRLVLTLWYIAARQKVDIDMQTLMQSIIKMMIISHVIMKLIALLTAFCKMLIQSCRIWPPPGEIHKAGFFHLTFNGIQFEERKIFVFISRTCAGSQWDTSNPLS